jgi:ABC-type molybdenum transport system ATPase subunit/photorepair protein PhrA
VRQHHLAFPRIAAVSLTLPDSVSHKAERQLVLFARAIMADAEVLLLAS